VPVLALVHVLSGLAAVIVGCAILGLRKGDRRHRLLGWVYVVAMLASLAAIFLNGLRAPTPFHGYAAVVACGIVAAIVATRRRDRITAWRSWHAALMLFSLLGAAIAIGGVAGGLALGVARGPAYYRMFNVVIVCGTAAGLWFLGTRTSVWGRHLRPAERRARLWFTGLAAAVTSLLVLAQM
jgi:uncharacterized membrane protein